MLGPPVAAILKFSKNWETNVSSTSSRSPVVSLA